MRKPFVQPVRLGWLVERRLNLWVWCEKCSHNKTVAVAPLHEKYGDASLSEVKHKFRCAQCGSRDVFLRPDWHSAGWTRGVVSKHDKLPE